MNRLAVAPKKYETISVSFGSPTSFLLGYFVPAAADPRAVRYSLEEIDDVYSAIDRPYAPLFRVEEEPYGIRIVRPDSVVQIYPWHRVFEVVRRAAILALPGDRFEIVDGEVRVPEGGPF